MRSSLIWAFTAVTAISPALAATVSKSGRCGAAFGLTCQGSSYGNCCSQYDFCGTTSGHCGTGCQKGFGTCTSPSTPVTPSKKVSPDGTCGGKNGYTCQGSAFGNCCSQYGWCDNSAAHCGTGCQSTFGTCSSSAPSSSIRTTLSTRTTSSTRPTSTSTRTSSSAAAPSSTVKVSTNGRCGSGYNASPKGQTCLGSSYGNCCSQYSYCGSTDAYCGKGCQPGFGDCPSASSSSSSAASSSTSSSVESSSSLTSSTVSSTSSDSSSTSSTAEVETSTTSSAETASSTTSSAEIQTSTTSSAEIVSSTTSSVTTSTAAPAAPTTCAVQGYMRGVALFRDRSNDYENCKKLCLDNTLCLSFAVVAMGEAGCVTYSTAMSAGFMPGASAGTFYGRECFTLPTSSSMAESTTSSEASSSTAAPAPAPTCEGIRGNMRVGPVNMDASQSYEACRRLCLQDLSCRSFGVIPDAVGNGACTVYTVSREDDQIFQVDPAAERVFYERDCTPAPTST